MGKIPSFPEFAYNNNVEATIKMAPYEALCGRQCRSLAKWDEVSERKYLGLELMEQALEAIQKIQQ